MRRLPVIAHLPHEEVGRRYRHCPDPKEKTRWHLIWLLLRPGGPACSQQAAPLVGLCDVYARAVLRRWNAHGPDGLADRLGVKACPQTGWRWLKRLGFRLVVPRPRHPKAASAEAQARWL